MDGGSGGTEKEVASYVLGESAVQEIAPAESLFSCSVSSPAPVQEYG